MTRTHPPRGRSVSLMLLAAAVLSVLLAVPASAAGDLAVSVSATVTGRDALHVTPEGLAAPVPLVIEVTDAGGRVGTWRYPAGVVDNDAPLAVDLSSPDSGSPPRNGRADVTVSGPAGAVATARTTIDRTPPAAVLQSVVRGSRVGLTWTAVSAADQVTYKLERIATGGAWTVVQSTTSADGFTDRGLQAGRYRYRLTAGVPSADDGMNWAAPTAVQIRIAAPAATPSPTASPNQSEDKPAAQEPAAKKPAAKKPASDAKPAAKPRRQERPRSVAATGTVRGPVASGDTAPQLQTDPTPLIATADEPAVDGAAPPVADAAVPSPEVAAPGTGAPAAATPATAAPPEVAPPLEPFPVTVPPAGSLAVRAATHTSPDPVTLLSGLVFLLLGAGAVGRRRKRTGQPIIPVWVARR